MLNWSQVWACCSLIFLCASGARAGDKDAQRMVLDPEVPPQQANGESTGFGHSLVWVGGRLVIGSPRSYLYGDRGGALWFWSEEVGEARAISVPGLRDWSSLGWSLASQAGDPVLAAGAPGEQVGGIAGGAVHLLQAGAQTFHWLRRIEPRAPEANAGFGHALQWNGGGLWISAPFASGSLGYQEGHLAHYVLGPSGHRFKSQTDSPSPQSGARFGEAFVVAGGSLIVGAPGQQGGGAVFVMQQSLTLGSSFQELRQGAAAQAHAGFGSSVALTPDGLGLAIGAPHAGAGTVHLFERRAAGPWRFRNQVHAPLRSGASGFGTELSFSDEGLWIAAPGANGQVYCLVNWRSGLTPLLFAGGDRDVALGRSIRSGSRILGLGAPGHGVATFQPSVRARVHLEGSPGLYYSKLDSKRPVHAVAHARPGPDRVVLGVGGLPPRKRVEFRVLDTEGAGWTTIGQGRADAKGAWNWSGELPHTDSPTWKLALHSCNAALDLFELRNPSGR
ncbi:MAG: hypothetical protein GY930_18325 [bacterium]|nr:hypothetical protein [bacterium]